VFIVLLWIKLFLLVKFEKGCVGRKLGKLNFQAKHLSGD
jgi:hypothetical protein